MRSLNEWIYALALTLWIGGLWTIGYIVAPTLFSMLADRVLAGTITGKLFTLMAYIGLACGAYLILFRLVRFGGACVKHVAFWILLVMLALTVIGEFGVQPLLATLKSSALPKEVMEGVLRDRFMAWHGVASVLYVIQSGLGLVLVALHGRNPR